METKKKIEQYSVSLLINNEEYKEQGETILEALEKIIKPAYFKTTGIIKVEIGNLKAEKIIPLIKAKKLFVNKISREILAKQLLLAIR